VRQVGYVQGISTSYSTCNRLNHVHVTTTAGVAADTVSFQKCPVRITAGTFPILAQVFMVFLHATASIITRLGYNCFLPNPSISYQIRYLTTNLPIHVTQSETFTKDMHVP